MDKGEGSSLELKNRFPYASLGGLFVTEGRCCSSIYPYYITLRTTMSNSPHHYLSLSVYPLSSNTIETLKSLADVSVFGKGDKNKASKVTAANRYDCLVRLLSSLIALTKLSSEVGLYRSMKTSAFSGSEVSYRVFKFVSGYLIDEGYLIRVEGEWSEGMASTFYITEKLVKWCRDNEIVPRDFVLTNLVRTKYPSHYNDKGKKIQGEPVADISTSADYQDQVRIVSNINHYLSKHTLSTPFVGLFRSFSNYQDGKKKLTDGGRLYAEGGSYQSLNSEQRLTLTIDGEAVAEVDIKASHLTLMCFVARTLDNSLPELDPDEDPYHIEDIPRPVVKQWIVAFSSKLKPLTRWSKEATEKLIEQGVDVVDYKVKEVGEAVANKYPFIHTLPSTAVNWGYLQRREADALIATMRRLANEYDVPSYPVHDSLIVKQSDILLVTRVMKESFSSIIGFTPALKVTTSDEVVI